MAASFIISLDFELHWGVFDSRSVEEYRENLLGARDAVREMLELFREREVHATWATVGALFCQSRAELLNTIPAHPPQYLNPHHSAYTILPTLGVDEQTDPLHFAASLVKEIAATPGQELATHTFSHLYCLEHGVTAIDLKRDLVAAIAAARQYGVAFDSIVFPRNQVNPEFLAVCCELGISVYRGTVPHALYSPRAGTSEWRIRRLLRFVDSYLPLSGSGAVHASFDADSGMINIPASRFLRPYNRKLKFLEPVRIRRVIAGIQDAAHHGAIYHLWWHPHNFGKDRAQNMALLSEILDAVCDLRNRGLLVSETMAEAAERFRTKHNGDSAQRAVSSKP